MADTALAGRVIASHYAEPVERAISASTTLRETPSTESDALDELSSGDSFWMLDDSLGWAWGYAGSERRVGYIPSDSLRR